MNVFEEIKMFEIEVDRGVYDTQDLSGFSDKVQVPNIVSDRTMMCASIGMDYIGKRVDIKVGSHYLDSGSRESIIDKLEVIDYKRRGRLAAWKKR